MSPLIPIFQIDKFIETASTFTLRHKHTQWFVLFYWLIDQQWSYVFSLLACGLNKKVYNPAFHFAYIINLQNMGGGSVKYFSLEKGSTEENFWKKKTDLRAWEESEEHWDEAFPSSGQKQNDSPAFMTERDSYETCTKLHRTWLIRPSIPSAEEIAHYVFKQIRRPTSIYRQIYNICAALNTTCLLIIIIIAHVHTKGTWGGVVVKALRY